MTSDPKLRTPNFENLVIFFKFVIVKIKSYYKMKTDILKRITINPEVCHGKPTIRNTRHMVESILEYLAGGDSTEDILNEFPELEKDDILACLAFAAKTVQFKDIEFPAA
jgi:uncharacterized protein (DUF433 family)